MMLSFLCLYGIASLIMATAITDDDARIARVAKGRA